MTNPETRLRAFQAENNIFTKGPLSLVIQFTRLVRDQTFPLNPDDFQTSGKGQVAGLGGGNLKKILKEHGIDVDVNSIFDTQVKRLHAYKRQLMNVLRIISV